MLTLVTGGNNTRALNRARQIGFSLVEVLVSLFIMGLMASAVILNLPRQEDELVKQANKLAAHLQMAAQTSLVEQSSTGVQFEEDGYSLVKYDGEKWEQLLTYKFDGNDFPQMSLIRNGAVLDLEKLRKSPFPVIQYDMTGLATPFSIILQSGTQKITLTGAPDGRVTLDVGGATT